MMISAKIKMRQPPWRLSVMVGSAPRLRCDGRHSFWSTLGYNSSPRAIRYAKECPKPHLVCTIHTKLLVQLAAILFLLSFLAPGADPSS
jgi:hypothetical protein